MIIVRVVTRSATCQTLPLSVQIPYRTIRVKHRKIPLADPSNSMSQISNIKKALVLKPVTARQRKLTQAGRLLQSVKWLDKCQALLAWEARVA